MSGPVDESDFDLAGLVQSVIEETGLSDPGDIAAKLLENMTAEQLDSVALALLRNWVRIQLHKLRVAPVRPAVREESGTARRAGARNSARRRDQLTPQDRLERALSGPFCYNNVNWGRTGDLTVDQVRLIAASYHHSGSVLVDHGRNWDALAEAMVQHGVTRVRDLSATVLHAFFAPEADAA
jgi:hypothetical protein